MTLTTSPMVQAPSKTYDGLSAPNVVISVLRDLFEAEPALDSINSWYFGQPLRNQVYDLPSGHIYPVRRDPIESARVQRAGAYTNQLIVAVLLKIALPDALSKVSAIHDFEQAIEDITTDFHQLTDDFRTNLPDDFAWQKLKYESSDYGREDRDLADEMLMLLKVTYTRVRQRRVQE